MSWRPSGPRQRQPRALVVGLRRILKDPKANVRQRLRACEILATIAGYIGGFNSPKAETGKWVKGGPLSSTANPDNSNGLNHLIECADKQE